MNALKTPLPALLASIACPPESRSKPGIFFARFVAPCSMCCIHGSPDVPAMRSPVPAADAAASLAPAADTPCGAYAPRPTSELGASGASESISLGAPRPNVSMPPVLRFGGAWSSSSVVVGCVLIGTLLNAFTIMDVNSEVQNIIKGVVLLAAIVLDNWLHPRDEETARQGD